MLTDDDLRPWLSLLPYPDCSPPEVGGFDYSQRCPSPPAMINASGAYDAGWYDDFTGQINPEASRAWIGAYQRWMHVSFDSEDLFVVGNLAHLAKAGNVAILAVDKRQDRFEKVSLKPILWKNRIRTSPDGRRIEDPDTGSSIDFDGEVCRFDLRARELRLEGEAEAILGPPFCQITAYHHGYGSLQWWGHLKLRRGSLTCRGQNRPLTPGALGAYDKTFGHRRRQQHWNWVSAVGRARAANGREELFSIQISKDRPAARPLTQALKNSVWLGSRYRKLPQIDLSYQVLREDSRQTSPWRLTAPLDSEGWSLDLRFTPRFQRREKESRLWIYAVDFNQYYGSIEGRLSAAGEDFEIQPTFAVAEDSQIRL